MPILGDIPLIGRLFRSSVDQHLKRNLVIFVSARLINPAGEPVRADDEKEEIVEMLAPPDARPAARSAVDAQVDAAPCPYSASPAASPRGNRPSPRAAAASCRPSFSMPTSARTSCSRDDAGSGKPSPTLSDRRPSTPPASPTGPGCAKIVFADPTKRRALEHILHPAIRSRWAAARGGRRQRPTAGFASISRCFTKPTRRRSSTASSSSRARPPPSARGSCKQRQLDAEHRRTNHCRPVRSRDEDHASRPPDLE